MQQLPLFQGLSFAELSEIVEWMKMDFSQLHIGDTIVSQGEKCNSIIFVLNGNVCAEYIDTEGRFILSEHLSPTLAIEPYNLYGMFQNYSRTYWMESDGSTLVIPKNIFNELLKRYQIIRTNYMNIICKKLQYNSLYIAKMHTLNLREKIIDIIKRVACTPKGSKQLKIKMETIADIIGETRLNVSKELNKMKKEHLVVMKRGEIDFINFE